MKWVPLTVGLVCAFLLHAGGQEAPAVEDVSDIEQAQWVRWVIPLPKEIAIPNKVDLPASQVKITLRQGAGEVEKTAAQELASLFKDKAGADVAEGPFEILIGVCDEGGRIGDATVADVARLKDLPNREQAYVIRPIGENRLVLTALDERGVYYAAQTLRQLLENTFADGKVTIPLTSVTDWPDLDQRGEWGGLNWFPPDEIEWLARHKMNMVIYGVRFHIREDGRGGVKNIHPDRIAFGRRHALNMVPFITHFCLLGERTNLFQVYPQLKGAITPQGEIVRDLGEANVRSVPCPSQPKMAEVLADFMCAMAAEGATDIDCWLSEGRGIRCLCEKCLGQGDDMHYALEARAYVKAWRIARKQYPKLRVRVTLTQGTYNTNDKVLAEVPPEVGVTYYCSWGTYNSLREPMIYPLLEDFAAKGGRLGVVPHDDVGAYTVGRDAELALVDADLDQVEARGGAARAFLADYGVGKTHLLELVQGRALARGFLVAQAVLDPRETQPSHPKRVYRALMRALRYPDRPHEEGAGLGPLLARGAASEEVMSAFGVGAQRVAGTREERLAEGLHLYLSSALAYWQSLDRAAESGKIRGVSKKERDAFVGRGRDLLLDWIEGHPTISNQEIDGELRRLPGGHPKVYSLLDYRPWSRIYGYLLTGVAALAKAVGYRGLVVLLDEAEFYALLSAGNRAFARHLFRAWTGAALGWEADDLPFAEDEVVVGGYGVQRELPPRYGDAPGLYVGLAMTPNPEGLEVLGAAVPEDRVTTLGALGAEEYAELTRRVCDFYASARADWELPGPLVGALTKVVQGLHGSGFVHNPRHAMKFLIEFLDVVRYHPARVGEVVRGLQEQTLF